MYGWDPRHLMHSVINAGNKLEIFDLFSCYQDENVKIIAIGVGRHVDNNELKAIAMGKQENTLHVNNFSDLHNKINVILAKSCKKKVRARPTYKFEYY